MTFDLGSVLPAANLVAIGIGIGIFVQKFNALRERDKQREQEVENLRREVVALHADLTKFFGRLGIQFPIHGEGGM